MGREGRTVDERLAALAGRSHGVVTRAQLARAGITPAEVRRRVERGTLLPVHRGVYRVGHRAPSVEATYLAAVWACGERALLSGRAAAHLLGLMKGAAPPPEVTTPSTRVVRGVSVRRYRRIAADDGFAWRGVPTTRVAQTLVDLAAVLTRAELARACHEAGVLHRTTPAQVEVVLDRRRTAPGAGALRAVMRGDVQVTLSGLERRFLQRLREAGLPLPVTNRPAGGRRVDCRWPKQRLTVELDSYTFHSSRHAWEQDRRREREAHARGDDFRRYTHDDVFAHPAQMLRELRSLLPSLPG